MYTREESVGADKWPYIDCKKYIKLSLLSMNDATPQEAHEYTKSILRGKISHVAPERKLGMADIARKEDGSAITGMKRCILVEGAPGVGKSTFICKLCRKWGKGKILQQYRVVVLLRLCEERVRGIKTVNGLFRRCGPLGVQEMEDRDGEGVMLVMQGWDELPYEQQNRSFFLDLIKGKVLSDATVLVTSRPYACEGIMTKCQAYIYQHVKITGFTEDNIHAYVKSYAGKNENLLHDLQCYTTLCPHIMSMMYIPLNAAIVVKVYRDSWKKESTIPKTMTELYSSLVRSLLLRYLTEHPVHSKKRWRLRQFSDLPSDTYRQLCLVSEIAYKGVMNEQQVIFTDLPDNFDHLGLMQCVPELYVDEGAAVSYNFLHLTMQEFFAAYHISLQPIEKQIELFQLHHSTVNFGMILKFTAGLTSFKNFLRSTVSLLLTEGMQTRGGAAVMSQAGFHLLFEMANRSTVAESLGLSYYYRMNQDSPDEFSPYNCYVVGFVTAHSNCKWGIDLRCLSRNEGVEQVAMFARGTVDGAAQFSASSDNEVDFSIVSNRGNTNALLEHLFATHSSFLNRIGSFRLHSDELDFASHELLFRYLPLLPHLHTFYLSVSLVTIQDSTLAPSTAAAESQLSPLHPSPAMMLISTLQKCKNLKCLNLHCTKFAEEECRALVQWLSSPACSVKDLTIEEAGDNLNDDVFIIPNLQQYRSLCHFAVHSATLFFSAEQIVSVLDSNSPSLKSLSFIDSCLINSQTLCRIIGAIRCNTSLKELCVTFLFLDDDTAVALADMLSHNNTLEILNLENCSINPRAIYCIANSLKDNTSLEELSLKNSVLKNGDEAAEAFADMLCCNQTLECLDVTCTGITGRGVCCLADALLVNNGLKILGIQANTTEKAGIKALANMLRCNKTLQVLRWSDKEIKGKQLLPLALALHENSALEVLDLGVTRIEEDGAKVLADMFVCNTTLKGLHVLDRDISEREVELLVESLKCNNSIVFLKIPKHAVHWNAVAATNGRIKFHWE